jgi:[citrate (pro-3S)-lyase] ligase
MHELLIRHSRREYGDWLSLLEREGILPAGALDRVYGLYEGERLVATGARCRNVLKCFAVEESYRGGAVFNEIASALITDAFRAGFEKLYVYTKKDAVRAFESLGFTLLEHVGEHLYFLERAEAGFSHYLEKLSEWKSGRSAAVVMNANPFTLGHRFLVEKAAAKTDRLHLFVLSDDISEFSFAVRKRLVLEGTKDLSNIVLHDTDQYLVSSATFPSYFISGEDLLTKIQATLDAKLFKYHIAPVLGITVRFVGSEPFSRTTAIYNRAMESVFAGTPELVVLPRLEIARRPVSATEVRHKLREGDLNGVKQLVPPSTFRYLVEEWSTGSLRNTETTAGGVDQA